MNYYHVRTCEICNCKENETTRFYKKETNMFKKDLCNKHYIQLHRHGRITDWDVKPEKFCEICGSSHDVRRYGINKESKYYGKLLCCKHYNQLRNKKEITDKTPSHLRNKRVCAYCNSTKDVVFSTKYGNMLCRKHYDQVYLYGKILKRTIFDKNKIIEYSDYAEIIIYNAVHTEKYRAIIDIDDVEIVKNYKWGGDKYGYISTHSNQKSISLHRLIMQKKFNLKGKIVDHIDRNPLNNRKSNLRIAGKSLNAINSKLNKNNSSGVTGVSYSKGSKKWRSYINYEGKRIELGYYENKERAIKERLLAENKYYEDKSPQKHLFKEYDIK